MRAELSDSRIESNIVGATSTTVDVDAPACERAFAGVLRNAAEAGATAMNICIAHNGAHVRIEFSDNGSGIEERWRERVTEPFFSTRRAQGASGLGLTLAQEIVRRHAGTLNVFSNGHGTTVTIELPQR
jgi:signal transduction histidine kinase